MPESHHNEGSGGTLQETAHAMLAANSDSTCSTEIFLSTLDGKGCQ